MSSPCKCIKKDVILQKNAIIYIKDFILKGKEEAFALVLVEFQQFFFQAAGRQELFFENRRKRHGRIQ